jgi:hypothetical protein
MGMNVYTVHEPPDPPADRLDRADAHVFVKDGFTWAAAVLTPFWLLANRMWLVLVGYLVGMTALQFGLTWIGAGQQFKTLLMIAVHVLIGFEADTLKRWTLDRKGWRMVGSVAGRNWSDCERRFFEAWLPGEPYIRADALTPHGGSLPLISTAERRQGRWRFPLTPKS